MLKVVNINVGVLGHVDSGKTSLVAALSDVLSVAALDKHPQSKERGITLDIGLSAIQVRLLALTAVNMSSLSLRVLVGSLPVAYGNCAVTSWKHCPQHTTCYGSVMQWLPSPLHM